MAGELGRTVEQPASYGGSKVVGKVVYDNLLLKFGSQYESSVDAFCRIVYQTIQITTVALLGVDDDSVSRDLEEYGGWNMRGNAMSVVRDLTDFDRQGLYKDALWAHVLSVVAELARTGRARAAQSSARSGRTA